MRPHDDLCDSCGYHLILKKVIDISDMHRRNTATGFERLLQDQLHESESSRNVLLWMKIVAAFLLLGILFMCLGQYWWVGVLAIGAAVAFYWAKYHQRKAGGSASDSDINRDPLSALLWSGMLGVQRAAGWRKFEWPLPKARSLTLRDSSFGDDELGELNLSELEALDIEGTGVTDQGLTHLHESKQLKFLVVRRTGVTPFGAARLQENLPQTLVWY
jgi:hypothetical protein